jgi:multidrug resistance efflux pump
MNIYRRLLCRFGFLGVALVLISVTGAGWVLKLSGAGFASEVTAPDAGPRLVCYGYVDLERGVASLYPLAPGRVNKVEIRETESVKTGTILLRLDDQLAQLHLREAEANLEASKLQASEAQRVAGQHQLHLAQQRAVIEAIQHRSAGAAHVRARKRALENIKQLDHEEVAAADAAVREVEALETAEKAKLRELELCDPSVAARHAQVAVDVRQAQLEQAARGVEDCVLRAPVDGTVLRILVGPGDVLGAQPKQPAVLFCPNEQRIVRAEVEQEFAHGVAAGQPACIQDDIVAGGPTWHGQVLRVSDWYTQRRSILHEPFQLNDVRTLECLIALVPGQPPLRIGQRVRVTIMPQ